LPAPSPIDREQLANDLYCAVVIPDTIWWGDLTPDMQESWLRAADYVIERSGLMEALYRLSRFTSVMMSPTVHGQAGSFNDLRYADEVLHRAKPGEFGSAKDAWPGDTARALADWKAGRPVEIPRGLSGLQPSDTADR
jgi:hypothetical protein